MTVVKRFRAFDTRGRNPHIIPNLVRIDKVRLRKGEWRRKRKSITADAETDEATVIERVIRYDSPDHVCEHCSGFGDDPDCGLHCYTAFHEKNFCKPLIELRGPGPLGYGAFVSSSGRIKKGQCIGEYIGEIRPMKVVSQEVALGQQSMYCFDFPTSEACVVDSAKAGNWTRFINSSCVPNLAAWGSFLGKRHLILFWAKRDIEPGEELSFNYGAGYFTAAGILCGCTAKDAPHLPGGGTQRSARKESAVKKSAAKKQSAVKKSVANKRVTKKSAAKKVVAKEGVVKRRSRRRA